MKALLFSSIVMLVVVLSTPALGKDYTHSTPGINGYDPVAYFTDGKPMKGSGYHVADFEGVTYAFASKEHKEMFEAKCSSIAPLIEVLGRLGGAIVEHFTHRTDSF